MKTKITKIIILIVSGLLLVLAAAFVYINNDLSIRSFKKPVLSETPVNKQIDEKEGIKEEADLDNLMNEEDATDSFDDIVM